MENIKKEINNLANELIEIGHRLIDLNEFATEVIDFKYRANELYKISKMLLKINEEIELKKDK